MTGRPSRRDVERALADLTDDAPDADGQLTLCELLSYDLEVIDREAGIVRIVETGELRRWDGDPIAAVTP